MFGCMLAVAAVDFAPFMQHTTLKMVVCCMLTGVGFTLVRVRRKQNKDHPLYKFDIVAVTSMTPVTVVVTPIVVPMKPVVVIVVVYRSMLLLRLGLLYRNRQLVSINHTVFTSSTT
jgi:hypothetical protein